MKKRMITLLAVFVYGGVLCGLLAIQLLMIDGIFPRLIANLAALVLTVLTLLAVILYCRHIKPGSSSAATSESEEQSASKSASSVAFSSNMMATEEIRIHVYDFLHQKNLSNREIEVAWLIYRGYTNLSIAEELFISEATVKKHASHIYEKLEVSGRKEFKSYIKAGIPVA